LWYKIKALIKHLNSSEKKVFYFFIILLLISGSSLSFIVFNKLTKTVPIFGGKYTEGIIGQPVFINPVIAGNNDADRDLISLLFCNAYDIAETLESEDSQSWQIRLKDNVLWHDGEKLTSDDIIFTLQKIQDPEFRSPSGTTWQGVSIERVSEREIKINLSTPYAFFEENLKRLFIIPKHIFADIPLNNWRLSDYNLQPIGCGPYKFDSYKKKTDGFITKYILKANQEYFDTPPYIENFEINFYTDPQKAVEDFNFARLDGLGNLSKSQYNLVSRTNQIFQLPTPRYYAVFMNQNTHPALKDKNVRLALDSAVNKMDIINKVFGGWAEPVNGPITPNFLENSIEIQNSDALNAKDILENSGWKLKDSEVREKVISKEKVSLQFDFIVPEIDFLIDTAHYLQKSWEEIGVKTNIIILTPEEINNEIIKDRNYQLLIFGNILGANPDTFSFWHSSQKLHPGLNLSLYSSKSADKLIETIRKETNPEERMGELSSLQSLIIKDIPAIFLYSPYYIYATTKDLSGFENKLIVTPTSRFDDLENWFVKTARELK